jgi:hypothetical protein
MIIYNVEHPGCHKPTYHDWGCFTYRSHMGLGDGDATAARAGNGAMPVGQH